MSHDHNVWEQRVAERLGSKHGSPSMLNMSAQVRAERYVLGQGWRVDKPRLEEPPVDPRILHREWFETRDRDGAFFAPFQRSFSKTVADFTEAIHDCFGRAPPRIMVFDKLLATR
jgi:hypothetical protein